MSEVKIISACEAALDKLQKLNKNGEHDQIIADLNWVINSYKNDGNPIGLYEKGADAKDKLEDIKKSKPRQVAKTLLTDLEKALADQG